MRGFVEKDVIGAAYSFIQEECDKDPKQRGTPSQLNMFDQLTISLFFFLAISFYQ